MRVRILFLCIFAAAIAAAADLPYAGKWKINNDKSDFGETTVTYTMLPSGEWRAMQDGQSYKFKMDGSDYSDGLGDMAAWKSIDAKTWQTTWKVNGRTLTTDTLTVGTDGVLTVNTKGTKPNGEVTNDTTTLQRISGGPGLAGKWKTKNVKSASPEVMEFVASDHNGLAYRVPAIGMTCDAKLDGKNYPCSGPTLPRGWTVAMTKSGVTTLTVSVQKDGKPFYRFAYSTSADGKTLTATGGAAATNEKIRMVYDRQ
ncbi:MAG: hypothetical protein WBY44_18350 [Bryobacteraceae bacterium]|jgi:hypothetical protein